MKTERHDKRANWGIRDDVVMKLCCCEKAALDENQRKKEFCADVNESVCNGWCDDLYTG